MSNPSMQQQTFSYLEQIVSNINHNNNNYFLTTSSMQIINNNNQQLSQHIPSSQPIIPTQYLQSSCTKHNNKKGQFYQTQYPWIRYCQNCALNLALCGKKIQKCLNSQQMFNKIKLSDILKSINQSIKQYQKTHQQHSIISSKLQQYRQQYSLLISSIDKYVQQIMQIRNILDQNIQKYINKEIKEILQKQTIIISHKMQLIHEKSKIQCGFVQLIGKEGEKQTQNVISKCQQLLEQNKVINKMKVSYFMMKLNQNINFLDGIFKENVSNIQNLKINIQPLNQIIIKDRFMKDVEFNNKSQQNKNQAQFYSKTLITDPSSSQDQFAIAQSNSGRIYTAYSTIQHSGLMSPCCQLNNTSQNLLTQQSQNRKNTRTALQLKSRCKSKSAHKKKVDLNVRQNAQNFNKKKTMMI